MLRALLPLAVAAAVAALLLTSRGGDGGDARAADRRVTVVLDDFRFKPQTIRARPGRLTLALEGRGRLGHNLHLRKGGRVVTKIKTLKPGARRTKTVELTRGDYRMFCSIANHEELGMYGTIAVR